MLGWAASQGATLPKPPMGTVSTARPRHSEGRDLGATHHGHWLPLTHTSVYSMGGGPDFSVPLGTWTPTFPPSSSAGAKSSSHELGEVVMLPCSSEGSHTTLNTKLLAIHLAGEEFTDFLAGGGVPSSKTVLMGQSPTSVAGAECQRTGDKPSALYSWMNAVPGYLGQAL